MQIFETLHQFFSVNVRQFLLDILRPITPGLNWVTDWRTYVFFGIVIILLGLAAYLFVLFIKNTKDNAKKAVIELNKELQERAEQAENSRQMEAELAAIRSGEMEHGGFLAKFDILLRQAGILAKFPGMSAELLTIYWAIAVVVTTILFAIIFPNIVAILAYMIVAIAGPYLTIGGIAKFNMGKVKQMLVIFCDTAINISATTTNLMELLRQCSLFMDEPLKGALMNAYNEAAAGAGGQWMALYHLRQSVPDEQFGAIIQDLEMASRYEANYQQVLKDRKAIVESHIASENKKKQLLSGGRLNISIMAAVCVLCINALADLVEGGIWNLLLSTPIGIGLMVIAVAILLYALKTCITPPNL